MNKPLYLTFAFLTSFNAIPARAARLIDADARAAVILGVPTGEWRTDLRRVETSLAELPAEEASYRMDLGLATKLLKRAMLKRPLLFRNSPAYYPERALTPSAIDRLKDQLRAKVLREFDLAAGDLLRRDELLRIINERNVDPSARQSIPLRVMSIEQIAPNIAPQSEIDPADQAFRDRRKALSQRGLQLSVALDRLDSLTPSAMSDLLIDILNQMAYEMGLTWGFPTPRPFSLENPAKRSRATRVLAGASTPHYTAGMAATYEWWSEDEALAEEHFVRVIAGSRDQTLWTLLQPLKVTGVLAMALPEFRARRSKTTPMVKQTVGEALARLLLAPPGASERFKTHLEHLKLSWWQATLRNPEVPYADPPPPDWSWIEYYGPRPNDPDRRHKLEIRLKPESWTAQDENAERYVISLLHDQRQSVLNQLLWRIYELQVLHTPPVYAKWLSPRNTDLSHEVATSLIERIVKAPRRARPEVIARVQTLKHALLMAAHHMCTSELTTVNYANVEMAMAGEKAERRR